MNNFIIAGYGKFGQLAFRRISRAFPRKSVTIVDIDREKLEMVDAPGVKTVHGDAARLIADMLQGRDNPVIIPMVPFHLAARVFTTAMESAHECALEEAMDGIAPNHMTLDRSNACYSWASFMCPDDCPEGPLCSVTGKPRDEPMHGILGKAYAFGAPIRVVRSLQILPGVGGYYLEAIRELILHRSEDRFALATSCRCHAIVTGLEI